MLDRLLVQDPVQPLLLITGEHEDQLWQFPGLAQELDDAGGDLLFLNIEEVSVDEDLIDSIEDVFDDFDLVDLSVEISSFL